MTDQLPDDMLCIEIPEPGGPEALRPGRRAVPNAADGEILVRVEAAGVNRPDIVQREGRYPPPPGVTDVPGLEIAGTIAALGGGVSGWNVGDNVTALVAGGGYAEYCVAPAAQALPVPDGLSMVEAAAIPETFFTVWSNVFDRCALQPGETLLVHGGSSGIGTTAIMLASQLGSHVIATAGSAEKCRACLDLGAELAIDYKEQDFVEEVMNHTGGNGADVVLDMVAGDYIPRNIACMAVSGRLCIIAALGGSKAEVDFRQVFVKRMTITGSTLRARDTAFKGQIAENLKSRVWPLFKDGKLKPVIYQTLTLNDAAEAHRVMEEGRHIGKIVLTIG